MILIEKQAHTLIIKNIYNTFWPLGLS